MKLYTLDNQFIKDVHFLNEVFKSDYTCNFTGIVVYDGVGKEWYLNGKYHRLDGPAIMWQDGKEAYCIHGKWCNKEQHVLLVDLMKLKNLL